MRKVFKILIWIALILSFLVGSATWYLVYQFEDKLVAVLVETVNKQVKVPMYASKIELSVLQKFPYATLIVHDFGANGSIGTKNQPLLTAKKIYVQLNVLNLLQENYTVEKVSISNAQLFLWWTQNHETNFNIWNTNSSDSTESDLQLQLQNIELNNVGVYIQHDPSAAKLAWQFNSGTFSGDFSGDAFTLNAQSKLYVEDIQLSAVNYLTNRAISLKTKLNVDLSKGIYTIESGDFNLGPNLNFITSGSFTDESIDLAIRGNNLTLEGVKDLVPTTYAKAINDYSGTGTLNVASTIVGAYSSVPKVEVDFNLNEGVVLGPSKIKLNQLALEGSFTNGSKRNIATTALSLAISNAQLTQSKFTGRFSLVNFNQPTGTVEVKGLFDLAELQEFLQIDTIESISGKADFDLYYKGKFQKINELITDELRSITGLGKVKANNVQLTLKNSSVAYEAKKLAAMVHKGNLLINEFEGKIGSSELAFNGILKDLLPFSLVENEKLTIAGELNLGAVTMQGLLALGGESSESSETYFNLPKNLNFNVQLQAKSFEWETFYAEDISGNLSLYNQKLTIDPLRFKGFEGAFLGYLNLNTRTPNNILFNSYLKLNSVNLPKLMVGCQNFGQNVLEARHVKGICSAEMSLACEMSNALKINENSIQSSVDLQIVDGELIEFELFDELIESLKEYKLASKAIKVDELANRLNHIYFDTLSNLLLVENQQIAIPKMDIHSSAMNIEIAGTHTFTHDMNYLLNFTLASLLGKDAYSDAGNFKKSKKGGVEFIVALTGNVDNPEVDFETKTQFANFFSGGPKTSSSTLNNQSATNQPTAIDFETTTTSPEDSAESSAFEIDLSDFNYTDSNSTQTPDTANNAAVQQLNKLLQKIAKEKPSSKKNSEAYNFDDDF